VIFDKFEFAQAVLLFDGDGHISREMHLAEFQAVLDGFARLHDLAGEELRAVYVEFDHNFHVRRVVFFLLPVNGIGEVVGSWSLPLMQLAQEGDPGKDLGAGPIQLVCKSQCPISYHKHLLWDPDLSSACQLDEVKKAIKNNILSVQFRDDSKSDSGGEVSPKARAELEAELFERIRREYTEELKNHSEQLLRDQRLEFSSFKEDARANEQAIKQDYDRQLAEYQRILDEKSRMVEEQKELNLELKASIDRQAEKFAETKMFYEKQIESSSSFDAQQKEAYRLALEAEFDARFLARTKDIQEKLQTREVELLYRDELEAQLHEEIARLREDKQHAIENTGNQLLQNLIQSGVSLVTFQPGAGHLTLPLSDISAFLESPTDYAADRCGVQPERYEAWLTHYHMPICQHIDEAGHICGEPIERIEQPIDYRAGDSDYCASCLKKNIHNRSHLRLAEG
jgi:hypothetical protein